MKTLDKEDPQMKTLAIDFDGTIHPYTYGWCGSTPADEPPIPGALQFVQAAVDEGYRIVVFTCRADHPEGYLGTRAWLEKYGFRDLVAEVTDVKPAAVAYIDDRAIHFDGNWDKVISEVVRIAQRKHGEAPAAASTNES